MNKIMLSDYIGKKNINIMVDISIRGQKHEYERPANYRLLENVYIKKDKKKNQEWLYVEWQADGEITLCNDTKCNDCGYSGVMIGDYHELNKLYLVTA